MQVTRRIRNRKNESEEKKISENDIEKPRRKKRNEYKRHRERSVQTVNNERKM
jgi:hypothetical protein